MATTIIFDDGSAPAVNFPAPDHPEEWREDLQQVRARAMGGRVVSVTRSASTLKNPILHWTSMDETDYNAMVTFIFTTVEGSTTQFTFTDWESTAHTVKYMGGLEKARSVGFDQWTVDLQLAVI